MNKKIGILILLMLTQSVAAWSARYEAVIDWSERGELSSLVSGVIKNTPVKAGDLVKKGAVLIELDTQPFAEKLKKANAKVARTKVVYDEAKREHGRSRQLFDETLLSIHQLELSRIAFIKAKSDYLSAQADLALAKTDLSNAVIRAPYDALILSRPASLGSAVVVQSETKPLVIIARTDKLVARINVSLAQSRNLKPGMKGKVSIDGVEIDASVNHIAYEPVNPVAAKIEYRVDLEFIPAAIENLRIGQRVIVILP